MRKRFFKKLSLGMALALVLGTTAHAGVAQAAAATWTLKKNSATVYLNEDNVKGTPDNYDFNFKNKPDNWKKDYSFNWYSENEEVATVAKGGVVTGVSVGEATIVCEIVNKKTFEVETVKAKVNVKANAAAVEISNAAKYDAEKDVVVKTGEVIDLNRTMYDENGNKTTKRGKFVTDYTRWYVLDENAQPVDETVATVNQKNGQFVINKAGIYALVCETYQSAKNPQGIVSDFVMVVVEDAKPAIDALQTTVRDFELVLDQPIAVAELDDDKKEEFWMDNIDVVLELNEDDDTTDRQVFPIKNITALDDFVEDGYATKVRITMWDIFQDGKEYTVGMKDHKSITDAEENKDITKVVYRATDKFTACVGKPDELKISIVNPTLSRRDKVDDEVYVTDKREYHDFDYTFIAYGPEGNIDVTEIYFDTKNEVLLTDGDLVGEIKPVSKDDNDLYYVDVDFNALEIDAYEGGEGKKYELVVEYQEYTKNGEVKTVVSATKEFTVKAEPTILPFKEYGNTVINTIGSYKNVKDGLPAYKYDWETRTVKSKIAANDPELYVAASIYDDWDRHYDNTTGELRFYSSNSQVADVDLYTGKFTPYEKGSVRINVYVADDVTGNETWVSSVTVKVLEERYPAKIIISEQSKTVQELYSHIVVGTKWDDIAYAVNGGAKTYTYYYNPNKESDGVRIGTQWLLDEFVTESNGSRVDDVTTPMDEYEKIYYVKVMDNHNEEVTNLGRKDFVLDEAAEAYFAMSDNVKYHSANGIDYGYPIYVYNADADVVEAISNADNYKRASVALHGVFGLTANERTSLKLTATVKKPVDEVVDDYQINNIVVDPSLRSSIYAANVKVYGISRNDVPVWEFKDFYYAENDIKTYVNRLNNTKVTLSEDEALVKAQAATGTALVYTITEHGKFIKAVGDSVVKVATNNVVTTSGSSVVTSITGETMNAKADNFITFNDTIGVEVGNKVLTTTVSNAAGDYVLTLYEITTNTSGSYKSTKATTATMDVNDGKDYFKATPLKIDTELSIPDSKELEIGNRLGWTADQGVRDVIMECFDIQLGSEWAGDNIYQAVTGDRYQVDDDGTQRSYPELDMLFNVRINGNTMYVKSIKVFVPAGNNEFATVETEVGWTITEKE